MPDAALSKFLASAIPEVASGFAARNPQIDADDFAQEIWAYVLDHPSRFEGLAESGRWKIAKQRLREGAIILVRDQERYRRAVKAIRSGYAPGDEQFYSLGVLRTLIPLYLDGGVTSSPPKGRSDLNMHIRGGDSDYMAMMMDIDMAMNKVSGYHRNILKRYFAYPSRYSYQDGRRMEVSGFSHAEIAGSLGISQSALTMRVQRALRAVQRELGGSSPYDNRMGLGYEDSAEPAA